MASPETRCWNQSSSLPRTCISGSNRTILQPLVARRGTACRDVLGVVCHLQRPPRPAGGDHLQGAP